MYAIQMNKYATFLFDLDGTLTDTGPTWLGILRDGLADFGILGLSDQQIAAHTHDWKQMVELGVPERELPNFTRQAYLRANERLPLAPLYDGAAEMLERLKANGKQIGIFTTMDRPILEPVVARYSFDRLFDAIIAGTDVEHRKPHPAGIHAALERLDAPAKTAIYLGDKDTDILCGKNAGTGTALFYPPEHATMYDYSELMASEPDHTIESWQQLIDIVRG